MSPNKKVHWTKTYSHNKKNSLLISAAFKKLPIKPEPPIQIVITRAGLKGFDYDNLVSACKGIRDTISSLIIPGLAPGQADSDRRLRWEYLQSKSSEYYVEIKLYPL